MLTLAPRNEDNELWRKHAKKNPFRFREALAESRCVASRNIDVQCGVHAQAECQDTTLQDAKCTSTVGLGPGFSVRVVSIGIGPEVGWVVLGHVRPSHRSGIVHFGPGQRGPSVSTAVASVTTILGVKRQTIAPQISQIR